MLSSMWISLASACSSREGETDRHRETERGREGENKERKRHMRVKGKKN